MIHFRTKLTTAIAIIIVSACTVSAASNGKYVVSQYIDAMVAGDYDKASQFWHPIYRETCDRFGIVFRDAPYKWDCMSPIVENLETMRARQFQSEMASTIIGATVERVNLSISTGPDTIQHNYHVLTDSTGSYMVPRFWLYLSNLRLVTTKYYDVYYRDKTQLNDHALAHLDVFTEQTVISLGGTKEHLDLLEQQRMEYYLGRNENEVSELLGFRSHGVHFRPSDIIVSHYIPDFHQITAFLITLVIEDKGLVTMPFVQNGLACSFGGRFGQHKDVMPQIAAFTIENSLFTLENVATYSGFYDTIGNIDFSYPLSVAVMATIYDETSPVDVSALVGKLSGSMREVEAMTLQDVSEALKSTTGKDWGDWKKLATERTMSGRHPNLKTGVTSDSGVTVFESGTIDYLITVKHDAGWYNVVVKPIKDDPLMSGMIVVRGGLGLKFDAYKSFLWKEQFDNTRYTTQLYSIQFSQEEVGIYDYTTNRLVAKYVSSFDSSGSLIQDGAVTFRFRDDIFPGGLENYICGLGQFPSESLQAPGN